MEITIELDSVKNKLDLFGPADCHLKTIRKQLDVKITARQSHLILAGPEKKINTAAEVIDKMQKRLIKRNALTENDVSFFLSQAKSLATGKTSEAITVYSHKKVVEPSTKGQLGYIETMLKNDLTFCLMNIKDHFSINFTS